MTGPIPSIFQHTTFHGYVHDYLVWKRQKQSRYSYAVLARQLGRVSVSLVAQVACGKRHASQNLLFHMSRLLGWSVKEFEFASHLVNLGKAKSDSEAKLILKTLERLKPTPSTLINEVKGLDFFENWLHVAILAMTGLKGFQLSETYILQQLCQKASARQISMAIKNIKQWKLIRTLNNGQYAPFDGDNIESPLNFPSQSVRKFHKSMLELAKRSIDTQPIDKRFYAATSVSISQSRVQEAQLFLDEMRRKFIENFEQRDADATYHLGIQLFSLTKY
ncbi:MAG: TIGR02147 family protein [Proteobacteria bacterium]|nr:TIGR02147 family protein [Pseudomonadota bacterium]